MVEIKEVDSLKPYFIKGRYIGRGKTSICFKNGGKVAKIYLPTHQKYTLFNVKRDMLEYLSYLGEIENKHYITPDEIIVKNGEVVAFVMDYIHARTLSKLKTNVHLNDIEEAIKRIEESTYSISEKRYHISDLHDRNILFNDDLYLIDIDGGILKFGDYYHVDKIFNENMTDIIFQVIDSIFKIDYKNKLRFSDYKVCQRYYDIGRKDYNIYKDIFDYIRYCTNLEDPSIKEIRSTFKTLTYVEKKPLEYYYNRL